MAMIPLTDAFEVIPEGEDIFRIYATEYKEAFGALKVYLVNAKGRTVIMNYKFTDNSGQPNDTAYRQFSWFARTALNDRDLTNVDPEKLYDHYVLAEVVHATVADREDPTKTRIFANLKNFKVADGFAVTPVERALTLGTIGRTPAPEKKPEPPKEVTSPTSAADLMALLSD